MNFCKSLLGCCCSPTVAAYEYKDAVSEDDRQSPDPVVVEYPAAGAMMIDDSMMIKDGQEPESDLFNYVIRLEFPPHPGHVPGWIAACDAWNGNLREMGRTFPKYPVSIDSMSFIDTLEYCNPTIARLIIKDVQMRDGLLSDSVNVPPYMGLVDVARTLIPGETTIKCDARSGFARHADFKTDKWTRPDLVNLAKMHKWFSRRLGAMPWYSEKTGKGVIVGGGFVLMCLFGLVVFDDAGEISEVPEGTDIDVFVIAEDRLRAGLDRTDLIQLAEGIVKEFIRAVEPIGIVEHPHVVDAVVKINQVPLRFQVVKSLQKTPSHTVNGFDIWGCMILYDGDKVHATKGAIHQISTGLMVADATKASKSWRHRLVKYAKRYGFAVYFPGVPQYAIDRIVGDSAPHTFTPGNNFLSIAYSLSGKSMVYQGLNAEPQSDYTDPDFVDLIERVGGFTKPSKYGSNLYYRERWTLDMHDPHGRFTGSFNPVDVQPYVGLDRFV